MDFVFAFKAKGTTKGLKEKILNVDEKKSFIFYDENGNEKEVSAETAWYADFYYQDSGRCRLPEFAPEVSSYKNIEYEVEFIMQSKTSKQKFNSSQEIYLLYVYCLTASSILNSLILVLYKCLALI